MLKAGDDSRSHSSQTLNFKQLTFTFNLARTGRLHSAAVCFATSRRQTLALTHPYPKTFVTQTNEPGPLSRSQISGPPTPRHIRSANLPYNVGDWSKAITNLVAEGPLLSSTNLADGTPCHSMVKLAHPRPRVQPSHGSSSTYWPIRAPTKFLYAQCTH